MTKQELGVFFCQNCGNPQVENVPYEDKPNENCGNCGFNDWIFEPTEVEEVATHDLAKQVQADMEWRLRQEG